MQIDTVLINQVVQHVQRDDLELHSFINELRHQASERLIEIRRAELLRQITQKDRDAIIQALAEDFASWSNEALVSAAKTGLPALQDQETPELLRQYEEAFGELYVPLSKRVRWVAFPNRAALAPGVKVRVGNLAPQWAGFEGHVSHLTDDFAFVHITEAPTNKPYPVPLSHILVLAGAQ